jgi:flagellin-like protein
MRKQLILNKRSQSEVITTVLLIVISIIAVILVSTYVINMIKSKLVGTECFKTAGQLSVNLVDGFTYYDSVNDKFYVSIARGAGDFNLTGMIISAGTGPTSTAYTIKAGDAANPTSGVSMYNSTSTITLPKKSETKTYQIPSAETITKVKIVPMISPSDQLCNEGADEQQVPSR